jgi:hypothetical protein
MESLGTFYMLKWKFQIKKLPRYFYINKNHGATTQASIHYGKYSYIDSINDVSKHLFKICHAWNQSVLYHHGDINKVDFNDILFQNVDHFNLLYVTH